MKRGNGHYVLYQPINRFKITNSLQKKIQSNFTSKMGITLLAQVVMANFKWWLQLLKLNPLQLLEIKSVHIYT